MLRGAIIALFLGAVAFFKAIIAGELCDTRCSGSKCEAGIDGQNVCVARCYSQACTCACFTPGCQVMCEGVLCVAGCEGDGCQAKCLGALCKAWCKGENCIQSTTMF
ncbi:uncharacterized protein isoform X1 [Choristoneura fumiferana]|uniref:uncharacterized protein isoform X1 n=1 Tax=Choristoneura fumiferana TaxID=7141 RepID=UPI003D153B06